MSSCRSTHTRIYSHQQDHSNQNNASVAFLLGCLVAYTYCARAPNHQVFVPPVWACLALDYSIRAVEDQSLCWTTQYNKKNDLRSGSNVAMQPCTGALAQQYNVTADGAYSAIRSRSKPGMCLTAVGVKSGSPIQLKPCTSPTTQRFDVLPGGGIKTRGESNLCFNIYSGLKLGAFLKLFYGAGCTRENERFALGASAVEGRSRHACAVGVCLLGDHSRVACTCLHVF